MENKKNNSNVRYSNGNLRRKYRARFKAMGASCGICKGKLGAIHYNEPSSFKYPLSFVIDEIIPVSRWKEYGYNSAKECCEDFNNLQAAHYYCNQLKSNNKNFNFEELPNRKKPKKQYINILDGDW